LRVLLLFSAEEHHYQQKAIGKKKYYQQTPLGIITFYLGPENTDLFVEGEFCDNKIGVNFFLVICFNQFVLVDCIQKLIFAGIC
jgi:hypothetical protein